MKASHAIEVRYLPPHGNKGPRVRLTSLLHPSNRRVVGVNLNAVPSAPAQGWAWLDNAGMKPFASAFTPRGMIVLCENMNRLP